MAVTTNYANTSRPYSGILLPSPLTSASRVHAFYREFASADGGSEIDSRCQGCRRCFSHKTFNWFSRNSVVKKKKKIPSLSNMTLNGSIRLLSVGRTMRKKWTTAIEMRLKRTIRTVAKLSCDKLGTVSRSPKARGAEPKAVLDYSSFV